MAGYLDARPRVGYFYTGKSSTQLLSDSIKKITIKESMAIPVVIEESVSVYEAICKMFLEDVGTLFVIDKEGYLIGVCSRKDLLRAAIGGQSVKETAVSINMSRMPNIIDWIQENILMYAAKLLIDKQIDALMVAKKV